MQQPMPSYALVGDACFAEKANSTSPRFRVLVFSVPFLLEAHTLVVTRLNRLVRSTLHLCQIAEELRRKGVHLQVIDQQIHTNDATSRPPARLV